MTTTAPPPAAPATGVGPRTAGLGDPGHPQATPWLLDLLADDGSVHQVKVPDTMLTRWDDAEALVTSMLTGTRYRPAGRRRREFAGRELPTRDPFPGVRP